jgi:hypothetical protein
MMSMDDISADAEKQERKALENRSDNDLKKEIVDRVMALEPPINYLLLIDIIIDLEKETNDLPR